jgi:hypothetical protein
MGYSVGIRVRSKALHTEMRDFLEVNYRRYATVVGRSPDHDRAHLPTEDLSYDHAKLSLGLDYQSGLGDWEREYVYDFCRWMAIRVGKKRASFPKLFPKGGIFPEPVPYIVYDGYEPWPVLVGTSEENAKRDPKIWWCCSDSLGVHNGPKAHSDLVRNVMMEFFKEFGAAQEKVGPWLNEELLKNPKVGASIEAHLKPIRDELARLSKLWDTRSSV